MPLGETPETRETKVTLHFDFKTSVLDDRDLLRNSDSKAFDAISPYITSIILTQDEHKLILSPKFPVSDLRYIMQGIYNEVSNRFEFDVIADGANRGRAKYKGIRPNSTKTYIIPPKAFEVTIHAPDQNTYSD